MSLREDTGETLPALLERRRGIPRRRTAAVIGGVLALLALVLVLLYDPYDGKDKYTHESDPVFTVLLTPGVVRRVEPRGGELLRMVTRKGGVRLTTTILPFELPAYEGDMSGVFPVLAQARIEQLRDTVPGFDLTDEGKARLHGSPGYQIGFNYGTAERPAFGREVYLLPSEDLGFEPGDRNGVIIRYRESRSRPRLNARTRPAVKAMKSAFRSFQFGDDRY